MTYILIGTSKGATLALITGLKQEKRKRPPTGGEAIYLQTGPNHTYVDAKEGVDGVLGALGEAQDPTYCR